MFINTDRKYTCAKAASSEEIMYHPPSPESPGDRDMNSWERELAAQMNLKMNEILRRDKAPAWDRLVIGKNGNVRHPDHSAIKS